MTDQHHPLTDEICERVSRRCVSTTTSIERDNMRTAADWQLEQVIEWIRRHPWVGSDCPIYDFEEEEDRSRLIADLKEAMRPTQEDN